MKRFLMLLSLTIFLTSLICTAQEKEQTKWGVTAFVFIPIKDVKTNYFDSNDESIDSPKFKDKSFGIGIGAERRLIKETYIRMRLGYSNIRMEKEEDAISFSTRLTGKYFGKQNKLHFSPGVFREFKISRLAFDCGFELPIDIHNNFIWTGDEYDYDMSENLVYQASYETTIRGGISLGIGAIMNFKFQIVSGFSIGAEINPTIVYYKLGGMIKSTRTDIFPPPSQVVTQQMPDKMEGLAEQIRFSFCINYSF